MSSITNNWKNKTTTQFTHLFKIIPIPMHFCVCLLMFVDFQHSCVNYMKIPSTIGEQSKHVPNYNLLYGATVCLHMICIHILSVRIFLNAHCV